MLNTELSHVPTMLLIHIYPKELKTDILTNTGTRIFKGALFTTAKRQEQPKYTSVAAWKSKM